MNVPRINEDIHRRWATRPMTDEVIEGAIRELHAVYAHRPDIITRWMDITRRVHAGETMRDIGSELGITQTRVFQLYWRFLWKIRECVIANRPDRSRTDLEVTIHALTTRD